MDIRLQPFEGYNLGTRKKESLERYWVAVDGIGVGFVDWSSPGHVVFIRTGIGPLEKERISEEVADLMGSKTRRFSEPPDVPEELLFDRNEGDEFHEFDEEETA